MLILDFEGALKFFRVNLPKKYMNENCRKQLCNNIYGFKVSLCDGTCYSRIAYPLCYAYIFIHWFVCCN